jgi:tRNA U34 5-carboxymethylaminomethyl modifying GTPase MnmE/TrmE
LNDSTAPLDRVKEALNERSKELLQERTTIKSFVGAASDIANYYRQALTTNLRTDIAVLNQPAEGHDIKDTPHPTNVDEHLKQFRQTIDSLQNGAINETGVEAGIAEAESAGSESLAALL